MNRETRDSEKEVDPIVSVRSDIKGEVEYGAIRLDLIEQTQDISKEEIESEYAKIRAKIDFCHSMLYSYIAVLG